VIESLLDTCRAAPLDVFRLLQEAAALFGHVMIARQRKNLAGRSAISFGLRLGWWPCFKGPFARIHFLKWTLDAWWGFPSYKVKS
jgi:hypothetical protein